MDGTPIAGGSRRRPEDSSNYRTLTRFGSAGEVLVRKIVLAFAWHLCENTLMVHTAPVEVEMKAYIDIRGFHPVLFIGLQAFRLEGARRDITVGEALDTLPRDGSAWKPGLPPHGPDAE